MTDEQLEHRMHVRMHIIEESKMEINEMPQEWYTCEICSKDRAQIDYNNKENIPNGSKRGMLR